MKVTEYLKGLEGTVENLESAMINSRQQLEDLKTDIAILYETMEKDGSDFEVVTYKDDPQ